MTDSPYGNVKPRAGAGVPWPEKDKEENARSPKGKENLDCTLKKEKVKRHKSQPAHRCELDADMSIQKWTNQLVERLSLNRSQ